MNQVCKLKKKGWVSVKRGEGPVPGPGFGVCLFFFFLKNVVSGLGLGLHITPLLPVVQLTLGNIVVFFFKSNELKKCFDISASQVTLLHISYIYPSSLFVFQKNIDYDLVT